MRNDKARYHELLIGLIAQGLFQVLEDNVIVKCIQDDVKVVQVSDVLKFSIRILLTVCKCILKNHFLSLLRTGNR